MAVHAFTRLVRLCEMGLVAKVLYHLANLRSHLLNCARREMRYTMSMIYNLTMDRIEATTSPPEDALLYLVPRPSF